MAALGVLVATFVLALVRLGIIGNLDLASPDELLPVLIASGLLCVIALARRRSATVTWLATIAAAAVVTIDLAAYAGAVRAGPGLDTVPWLPIAVSLCALLAVGTAATYAGTRPWPWQRGAAVLGVIAVVATTAAAIWALASPNDVKDSPIGALSRVTRTFLVAVTALTLVGLAGDAWPAAERARRRVALTHRGATSRGEWTRAWLRAFGDELAPGRSRARWAAVGERTRIARDIHADVVPGLRQTLADAERGVPADRLAASLRGVLADVEAVGATAHPIQLEIGGLVAALEWLAERVEDRSGIAITLEVTESPDDEADAGEPPRDVSSAAFRVAVLALGNVAAHAPDSQATIRIRSGSRVVELSIVDDGPGISDAALAQARATGRRGVADMAAEASACGAVLEIGPGPGDIGTAVSFWWELAPAR